MPMHGLLVKANVYVAYHDNCAIESYIGGKASKVKTTINKSTIIHHIQVSKTSGGDRKLF